MPRNFLKNFVCMVVAVFMVSVVWAESDLEKCTKTYIDNNFSVAYPVCMKSAEAGNAIAQKYVGYMLEFGNGVSKDERLAVEWYRKSAEQDNSSAQANLG
ncbi:MAG: hypothetical protein WCL71_16560, partial [Deltaproteobacteria bacterium]